jgi:hypothetical protein
LNALKPLTLWLTLFAGLFAASAASACTDGETCFSSFRSKLLAISEPANIEIGLEDLEKACETHLNGRACRVFLWYQAKGLAEPAGFDRETLMRTACAAGDRAGCLYLATRAYNSSRNEDPPLSFSSIEALEAACFEGQELVCAQLSHIVPEPRIASLRTSCDAGALPACALAGRAIHVKDFDYKDTTNRQIFDLYDKACQAGGMLGCFFLAYDANTARNFPILSDTPALDYLDMTCERGSVWACENLVIRKPDDATTYLVKACDRGAPHLTCSLSYGPQLAGTDRYDPVKRVSHLMEDCLDGNPRSCLDAVKVMQDHGTSKFEQLTGGGSDAIYAMLDLSTALRSGTWP